MKKVIVYSTPACVYCKMAKEFLDKNNIQYEEFNVAEDEQAREEMLKKSHQMGVPVIDVGGEIFVGFNQPELKQVLGLK